MPKRNWKNFYMTSPADVGDSDAFAMKVVAVVNGNFWSVFKGLSSQSDSYVANHGMRVFDRKLAEALFPVLANSDKKFYG